MKIELDYVKVGDYYLPNLAAEPYPKHAFVLVALCQLFPFLSRQRPP